MSRMASRKRLNALPPPLNSAEMARFDSVVEGVWGWNHLHHVRWHSSECCEVWLFGPIGTFDYNDMTRLVVLCHDHKVRAEVRASAGRLSVRLSLRVKAPKDAMTEGHPALDRHVACIREWINGNEGAYTVMYREMEAASVEGNVESIRAK